MPNTENSLDVASAMSIRGSEASLKDVSERSRDIAWLIYDDNRELIENDAEKVFEYRYDLPPWDYKITYSQVQHIDLGENMQVIKALAFIAGQAQKDSLKST
jgi:hypothetical protein